MPNLSDLIVSVQNSFPFFAYSLLFFIIFAESGLFFGFFFPGDSLLLSAGLLASQNIFNIYILLLSLSAAAVLGYFAGYLFGRKIGKNFANRSKSLIQKKYLLKAQNFYKKHGVMALIMARFVPILRTFVPIFAGVVNMNIRKFMLLNFTGGTLWVWGMLLFGYTLGASVPQIEKYLLTIVASIIILSLIPALLHTHKHKKLAHR